MKGHAVIVGLLGKAIIKTKKTPIYSMPRMKC